MGKEKKCQNVFIFGLNVNDLDQLANSQDGWVGGLAVFLVGSRSTRKRVKGEMSCT